jgi:UDP:flavonoid glycosyltransferase YjiC (YdhE family)
MRVLFCISGVGRGHVARCRPLITALLERGHECAVAVPSGRAAAVVADLAPVVAPPPGFREAVAPARTEPVAAAAIYDLDMALSHFQRDLDRALDVVVAYIDDAVARVRPNLVTVDQLAPATAVARARGLPVAQVTHAPLLPGHGPWMSWEPRRPPAMVHPPALPALRRALADRGLDAPASLEELLDGAPLIVPTHPGLGTGPGALHVRPHDNLGPLAVHGGAPPRRRPGRPVVAVQLSDAAPLLAPAVVRGVLAAGADAALLDGRPQDLDAQLRAAPGLAVLGAVDMGPALRACDAAVHHGGSGTAMACLAAGLPAVAIPANTEREHTARRLDALGAGIFLPVAPGQPEPLEVAPGAVTLAHRRPVALEERVADAIARLLADGAPGVRARALAGEIAELPAIAEAAVALERAVPERVA